MSPDASKYRQLDPPTGRKRPLGVWVLVVCHTVYGVMGIDQWSQAFLGPIPHSWSQSTIATAPYMLGLFAGLIASAWGAWLGNRHARILLLVLLTIAVARIKLNLLLSLLALGNEISLDSEDWRSALIWTAEMELGLLSWLLLNYWYFLRSRTRRFYAATTDRVKN
jgi:hypothetical protein